MAEETCPKCGKDETQPVSAVVRDGTWQASTSGVKYEMRRSKKGRLRPGFVPYSEQTTGRSKLAEMLAPPEPPFPAGAFVAGVLILAVVGIAWLGTVAALQGLLGVTLAQWAAALLIAVGLLYAAPALSRFFERERKRLEGDRERWAAKKRTWEALRYCARCDVVYNPETGATAPPTQMHTLL